MTDACIVYVTTASAAEAEAISKAVVSERLAACANILGDIQSVFFWDGAVQKEGETAMILKTARSRLDALTVRIQELHSYDEPCVVALPIVGGSQSFIGWIGAETKAGA